MLRHLLLLAVLTSPVLAQETMHTQAATMPSPGTGVIRPQFHYLRFGSGPETDKTERYLFSTSIAYGLARDWSLSLDIPFDVRRVTDEDDSSDWKRGFEQLDAMLKYRFYKSDTSSIDTARAALLLGTEFPSGSNLSHNSIDPYIGAVYTRVLGRHGFNQDVIFTINTGGGSADSSNYGGQGKADALLFNTSYLYRIAPDAYTADTQGAWYITAEMSNIYELSGDFESRIGPGLMYEGKLWAFEIMAQLPLYQDVDRRPEFDLALGVGLRFSF